MHAYVALYVTLLATIASKAPLPAAFLGLRHSAMNHKARNTRRHALIIVLEGQSPGSHTDPYDVKTFSIISAPEYRLYASYVGSTNLKDRYKTMPQKPGLTGLVLAVNTAATQMATVTFLAFVYLHTSQRMAFYLSLIITDLVSGRKVQLIKRGFLSGQVLAAALVLFIGAKILIPNFWFTSCATGYSQQRLIRFLLALAGVCCPHV